MPFNPESKKTPAIIPRIAGTEYRPRWQVLLAGAIRSADELLRLLEIAPPDGAVTPLAGDFLVIGLLLGLLLLHGADLALLLLGLFVELR